MQTPAPFEYARATSIDDALRLLAEGGEDAYLLAGGHSLLPMAKLRLARPELLIDINDLTDLSYIRRDGDWLAIGALTRHAELLASGEVGELFPLAHDAERVIADPVVRNRGTIGGSLCQADPAEDLSTVCDVVGAEVVIRGRGSERTIPVTDLHAGPYETTLARGEMLTEVRWPIHARTSSAYEKVERRVGDWAVTAAGASVTLGSDGTIVDASIGLTAVGVQGTIDAARDALVGQQPSEQVFAAAAQAAAAASRPSDDTRGTAEYKRHLADELTRRVLRRAAERAASGS